MNTGPLPIATSVPRATPARSTAAKKQAWYPATATIPAPTAPGTARLHVLVAPPCS